MTTSFQQLKEQLQSDSFREKSRLERAAFRQQFITESIMQDQDAARWAAEAEGEEIREFVGKLQEDFTQQYQDRFDTEVIVERQESPQETNPQRTPVMVGSTGVAAPPPVKRNPIKKNVPVLDPESEVMLQAIGEGDVDINELSSAELVVLREALPIDDLYPDKAQQFRQIGQERTGVDEMQALQLAAGRGATPFGSSIMDLTEDEIASLSLVTPAFKGTEISAAIATLFTGSTGTLKAAQKLPTASKTLKTAATMVGEGTLGAAYGGVAPGIMAELAGQPDSKVLNFVEAAGIAGAFNVGELGYKSAKGMINSLRGKTLAQAREQIPEMLRGEKFAPALENLPPNLRPVEPRQKLAHVEESKQILREDAKELPDVDLDIDEGGRLVAKQKSGQQLELPHLFDDPVEQAAKEVDPSLDRFNITAKASKLQALNAGTGALGGYAMGETPEERLEYSLAGAFLGATGTSLTPQQLGLLKSGGPEIWRRTRGMLMALPGAETVSKIPSQLRTRGRLPRETFYLKEAADNASNAAVYEARKNADDLRKILTKQYGRKVPAAALSKINEYLAGGVADFGGASDELYSQLQKMRDHKISMSRELRDTLDGEQIKEIIDDNLTVYLHRSYRVHDDPAYRKKMLKGLNKGDKETQRIYNGAYNFIKGQNPELTHERILGEMNAFMEKGVGESGTFRAFDHGTGILKERKDIPKPIRELMGEHKDPFVNYIRTVSKVSRLTENQKMLKGIEAQGKNKFLFPKKQGEFFKPAGQRVSVSKEGGDAVQVPDKLNPLSKYYTTPDLADAFRTMDEIQETVPSWYRPFLIGKSWSQVTKTVGSPVTHLRNLHGGAWMSAASGNNPWFFATYPAGSVGGAAGGAAMVEEDDSRLEKIGKVAGGAVLGGAAGGGTSLALSKRGRSAFSTTLNDLVGSNQKLRKKYQDYLRLGIVESSASYNEMKRVLKEASTMDLDKWMETSQSKFLKGAKKATFDAYRAEDDVWKIYTFENELAKYRNALKGTMDEEQIARIAAENTRNIMPNYGRVGRGIKLSRRLPVGNFVSFPAEVVRNSYNILDLSFKELANPKLRSVGARRLGSFLGIGLASTAGLSTASRWKTGVDEETDRKSRLLRAPWQQNSQFLYLDKDTSKGYTTWKNVDLSYSDPYEYIKKPAFAAMNAYANNEDPGKALFEGTVSAFGEFLEPWTNFSILTEAIGEATQGTTVRGQDIWNINDTDSEKLTKALGHLTVKAFEPGVAKDVRRMFQNSRDPEVEAAKLFTGVKVETFDPLEQLGFFAQERRDGMRMAASEFTRPMRSQDATKNDVIKGYARANEERFRNYKSLYDAVSVARGLDIKDKAIFQRLKKFGLSERDITAVMRGVYVPYSPSKEAIQDGIRTGKEYPGKEIREIQKQFYRRSLKGE